MRRITLNSRICKGQMLRSFLAAMALTSTIAHAQVPTISSISPNAGTPLNSVSITGTNFNDTMSKNIVYFGATMAPVTAASTTSLTVTVPIGATHDRVSVLNTTNHLRGYEPYPFIPTFSNTCFTPDSFTFNTGLDLTTGLLPYMAAIGDLDGDGKPDLVVVNKSSSFVIVYRNISASGSISASSFSAYMMFTVDASGTNVKLADIDGDGKLDIVTTHSTTARVDILRNTSTTGAISFATKVIVNVGTQPYEVVIADFDGDGKPDIATADLAIDSIAVVRNNSTAGTIVSGSFSAPVKYQVGNGPISIDAADLDGDGRQDIIVSNDSATSISVLRNATTGAGAFTSTSFAPKVDFTTGTTPAEVKCADIDGDGKPDILVVNSGANTLSVFHNTTTTGAISSSSFSTKVDFATGTTPESIAIADMNGDGKVDVLVSNNGSGSISIFRNTATSGTISTASLATAVTIVSDILPLGIVVGDIDGDTRPDIVLADPSFNAVTVFRNNPTPYVAAIAGTTNICISGTTSLSTTTTGGTWSMTNTALATITSGGIITGVAAGTDTAIYTLVCGGDTAMAMKPITISAGPVVGTISGSAVFCNTSTNTLTDTSTSGTWSSSNTAVATVSGTGVVTGLSAGTTVISYTETNSCGSAHDTMMVTVDVPAAGITGNDSVCESRSITLADASLSGAWTSSNSAVASVTAAGVVTGVTPGTATISYTLINSCGTTNGTKTIVVNSIGHCDSVSAVPVVSAASAGVTTYPNPSAGSFTLRVSSPYNEQAYITISNITGEKVKSITCNTNENREIELYQAAGIYLIQVSTDHGKYNSKVAIAR